MTAEVAPRLATFFIARFYCQARAIRRAQTWTNGGGVERLIQLEERIAPTLEAMGYEVVRVGLTTAGGRRTLQVMADRADGSLIAVDDCEAISTTLSAIFDVEEPVAGSYDLEVSSAGIDRPLTRPKDFRDYAGFEAKVETKLPVNGRRRFKGKLVGLNARGQAVMNVDGAEVSFEMDAIMSAKLVLTDELIAATLKGRPTARNAAAS
jgi:ribosome maturation factor RimP